MGCRRELQHELAALTRAAHGPELPTQQARQPPGEGEAKTGAAAVTARLGNVDVEDPLRDLGERRKEMMTIFKAELDKRKISYVLIQGDYNEREKKVMREVNALLQQF